MAARSGTYMIVTSVLTVLYLGGLYFTLSAGDRGPFTRVLKWVLLGLVTPIFVIGIPTLIAKKVLEHRRQSQAAPVLAPGASAAPNGESAP